MVTARLFLSMTVALSNPLPGPKHPFPLQVENRALIYDKLQEH